MRVVKFLLGTDHPSFVASAAGASIAEGILIVFNIIYFSPPTNSPVWQTIAGGIGGGLVFGLFLMPFFFMAISRAIRFMSPWEALAMLTAAWLSPLLMWHMRALGLNGPVMLGAVIAFIFAAFFTARVLVKRQRSSEP